MRKLLLLWLSLIAISLESVALAQPQTPGTPPGTPPARRQKLRFRFDKPVIPIYGPLVDIENSKVGDITDAWKIYLMEGPNESENKWWNPQEREERATYDLASSIFYYDMMLAQWDWKPLVLVVRPRVKSGPAGDSLAHENDDDHEMIIAYIHHKGSTQALLGKLSAAEIEALLSADSLPSELKVKAMQKVYVRKAAEGWRLHGVFQDELKGYYHNRDGDFDFYSHPHLRVNHRRERDFVRCVEDLCTTYDLPLPGKMKAYISDTRERMLAMIGLYHIKYDAESFAIQENAEVFLYHGEGQDQHEIAHIVFRDYAPTAMRILNEGIATYAANLNRRGSYTEWIDAARAILESGASDSAKKPIALDQVLILPRSDSLSLVFYASGAWLCARVAEKQGASGLKTLLSNSPDIRSLKGTLELLLNEDWEETRKKWSNVFYGR